MQNETERFVKYGWIVPLAVLLFIILMAYLMADKDNRSSANIAAWVQAIGSVGAILLGVWLFRRQYETKRADEEAETVAFVQAVRDEVETVWHEYSEQVGASVQAVKDGDVYGFVVPDIVGSLIIYPNNSARVGKIDDAALRKLIVTAYTSLRGHFSSLEVNNRRIMDLEQLELTYRGNDREAMRKHTYDLLGNGARSLKVSDNELKGKVVAMLAEIDAWLTSHPAR
jgi:hypothetical protein